MCRTSGQSGAAPVPVPRLACVRQWPPEASRFCMVRWLGPHDPFPPVDAAMVEPNGLLAVGRTLAVPTLLDAYARGIFPWFNKDEPVLWWSPDPRMILVP